jgi:hypothetical protein
LVLVAVNVLVFNDIGFQFAWIIARVCNEGHLIGVDVLFIIAQESPVDPHVVGVNCGIEQAINHRDVFVFRIEVHVCGTGIEKG